MGLFKRQLQSTGLCRLDNCNNSERSSRRFIKNNEAPYQTIGRRTFAATLGHKELNTRSFWVSILSECLACYLYVLIVCSTRISWTGSMIGHEPNLLAMALASGVAMMLLILTFRTVHVNPALTISFLLTGRIPIIRALIYILVHCMSSIAAIAFLYSIAIDGHAGALGLDNPHPSLEMWQILIVEFVISFFVTIVTYSTCSFSSYTSARQFILDQVGEKCSVDLFQKPNCDNDVTNISTANVNSGQVNSVATLNPNFQRPPSALPSSLATVTAPRRPMVTNFRVHPQTKCYMSDAYEISDEHEYEYDNHRIYSSQQYGSPETSPNNKVPPIEEMMHEESQLLAPNGFSLHMTRNQALVIGFAYTLASLTGIPASGASLNPARSFGPAFIMNRWENHWLFWLGPILGAVVAGFFYEQIFNPTSTKSVCYVPKLFRLSAHDMAKVGSKSRSYQQQQQKLSPSVTGTSIFPSAQTTASTNDFRTQPQNQSSTINHSPSTRHQMKNPMSNSTMLNPQMRDYKPSFQQLLSTSASLAHLQPSQFPPNNLEPSPNFMRQQQQQFNNGQEQANFENRNRSSAIINLIASKQQQSTINIPQRNANHFHSNSSSSGSQGQDFGNKFEDETRLYDDPAVDEPNHTDFGFGLQNGDAQRFQTPSDNEMMRLQRHRQLMFTLNPADLVGPDQMVPGRQAAGNQQPRQFVNSTTLGQRAGLRNSWHPVQHILQTNLDDELQRPNALADFYPSQVLNRESPGYLNTQLQSGQQPIQGNMSESGSDPSTRTTNEMVSQADEASESHRPPHEQQQQCDGNYYN